MGQKLFWQPPIVQIVPLKKITVILNMIGTLNWDRMIKRNPGNNLYDFKEFVKDAENKYLVKSKSSPHYSLIL